MASLVYASSRQSEGAPIWYPPTTSETAAGTAMTSQPPRRRRISAPGARPAAGTAAASPGSAVNVVAGSGDPMSVSATLSFPGAAPGQMTPCPSGYPAGERAAAAVNVLLTLPPPRALLSGSEEAVADADARLAVVQGAEPGREALVGVAVRGGDRVDVPDGLDHLGRVGQQRAGRLRFEVDRKSTRLNSSHPSTSY